MWSRLFLCDLPYPSQILPVWDERREWVVKMNIWTWTGTLANAFSMFSLGTSCSFAHLRTAANCGFLVGSADPPSTGRIYHWLKDWMIDIGIYFWQLLQFPGQREMRNNSLCSGVGWTNSTGFPEKGSFLCIIRAFLLFDLGPLSKCSRLGHHSAELVMK